MTLETLLSAAIFLSVLGTALWLIATTPKPPPRDDDDDDDDYDLSKHGI